MAIKAGRVGVNPSDVDSQGHVRGGGGGGGSSYTKQETDVLLNAKADKTTLGGLEFRNNDGTPQVKVGSEWVNFSGGGVSPVELWVNSDTSKSFDTQKITLANTDYDAFIVRLKLTGSTETYYDALVGNPVKYNPSTNPYANYSGVSVFTEYGLATRGIMLEDDGITIITPSSDSSTIRRNNNWLIPVTISGIKF